MLSRVRGLVVGYCLGDALARSPEPYRGPLICGTPSLVLLAGVEGLVRDRVRQAATGRPGTLPETSWHATARFAARIRRDLLPGVGRWRDQASPARWPDGWLSELSVLTGGRGSAPAIEAALALEHLDPRPGMSGADSAGDLVLPRTLPVALLAALDTLAPPGTPPAPSAVDEDPSAEPAPDPLLTVGLAARDVAAYTHGLDAQVIAVALTRTVALSLRTGTVEPLADLPGLSAVYEGVPGAAEVVAARVALRALADQLPPYPRSTDFISHGIPAGPRTALRATAEGLRCALTHPGRDDVAKAVEEALDTGQPGPAAVALALVGAAHGLEALPADAVARLDVGHVADQLALDLATQVASNPTADPDPAVVRAWLHRYPAW